MNMLRVRNVYKRLYSSMRHIWPWDRQYGKDTLENLQGDSEAIRKVRIIFPDGTAVVFGDLMNLGDFWDCDDFACGAEFLMKLIWKIRIEKEGLPRLARPYGQARGSQFRTMPGLHALNNSILEDEHLYFNDHDDGGRIWKASDQDFLFYASL